MAVLAVHVRCVYVGESRSAPLLCCSTQQNVSQCPLHTCRFPKHLFCSSEFNCDGRRFSPVRVAATTELFVTVTGFPLLLIESRQVEPTRIPSLLQYLEEGAGRGQTPIWGCHKLSDVSLLLRGQRWWQVVQLNVMWRCVAARRV